jgi:hypothetical protein
LFSSQSFPGWRQHKFGSKCVRIMPEDLADWIKRSEKPPKPKKAKLQEA